MKAFCFDHSPAGSTLVERDCPPPKPGPGQMLVRMRAATLNRGAFLHGAHAHNEQKSSPAGNEGAGEVVALGDGVAAYSVGDRIMGVAVGAFAEYAIMTASTASRVPETLSWEEAACATMVFTVAHDMLIAQGRLQAGEWVLVTGASSGVGVACVQLAKAFGARTIGTSGSAQKLDTLKGIGLDVGIMARGPTFFEETMTATSRKGVDIIVNNVGGSVFPECIRTLGFQGRLAIVGHVDGVFESSIDLNRLHRNRLTVFGVSASLRSAPQRAEAARGFARDVQPLFASGAIRPHIDRVFDFSDLPAAQAHMEANAHVGKIAVAMPEN